MRHYLMAVRRHRLDLFDRREAAILGALCLAVVVAIMAGSTMTVALPTISREYAADTNDLQWIVSSYSLSAAAFLLFGGSLADKFGHRRMLLVGLGVFGGASVGSTLAPSIGVLIATRAVTGIGGAIIIPSTLGLLFDIFGGDRRPVALGIWSAASSLGSLLGHLVGGALLQLFWWGSVFIAPAMAAFATLVMVPAIVPPGRRRRRSAVDIAGVFLVTLAALGLLAALIEGPVQGWSSATVLGSFGVAIAAGTVSVAWERHPLHPLLDLPLLRRPAFVVPSLVLFSAALAMAGSMFLLTQYLQQVLDYSPLRAGLTTTPAVGCYVLSASLTGVLAQRISPGWLVAGGLCGTASGLVILAAAGTAPSPLIVPVGMALLGTLGFVMAPMSNLAVESQGLDRSGIAAGTMDMVRGIGGPFGVAALGSVMSVVYRDDLAQVPGVPQDALSGLSGALKIGTATVAEAAKQAFVLGMGTAFIVTAIALVVTATLAVKLLPVRQQGEDAIR